MLLRVCVCIYRCTVHINGNRLTILLKFCPRSNYSVIESSGLHCQWHISPFCKRHLVFKTFIGFMKRNKGYEFSDYFLANEVENLQLPHHVLVLINLGHFAIKFLSITLYTHETIVPLSKIKRVKEEVSNAIKTLKPIIISEKETTTVIKSSCIPQK